MKRLRIVSLLSVALFILFASSHIVADVVLFSLKMMSTPSGGQATQNGHDAGANPFGGNIVHDDELGFRIAEKSQSSSGDFRVYANRKYGLKKDKDVFRVLCVGNSTTCGVVGDDNSYPAILQEILDIALVDCPLRVEVINAGVLAYNSWHTRLRAAGELDALSPDLCIVMDGNNDVITAAAIDDIEAAIRKKAMLTRQVPAVPLSMPQFSPAGWSTLVSLCDQWKTFRAIRIALDSLFTPDAMEKKMQAFGYQENIEDFVQGRRSKGIEVLLVNYGWITGTTAFDFTELQRLPFLFETGLFVFGRSYVRGANERLARTLNVPLVDLQPWVDNLKGRSRSYYRLFTDELHYTEFMNFISARAIGARILEMEILKARLGGCKPLPQDDVDRALDYRQNWGEYWAGYGYVKSQSTIDALTISSANMTTPGNEPCVSETQWCANVLIDEGKPAEITQLVHVGEAPETLVYYPRIFSNKGRVDVELLGKDGWMRVSEVFRSGPTHEWSSQQDQYSLNLPRNLQGAQVLRFKLFGAAQLYSRGGRFFFTHE